MCNLSLLGHSPTEHLFQLTKGRGIEVGLKAYAHVLNSRTSFFLQTVQPQESRQQLRQLGNAERRKILH